MTVSDPSTPEPNADANLAQQKIDATSSQQPPVEPKAGEEKPEDPNWRAFREARKKDRLEKEAAEKRAAEKQAEVDALKAAMEAAFARNTPMQQSQQQQYQGGYEHEETEDERIEKKVQAAIAAREAQAERERAQRETQEYPHRLVQAYPDFNETIASEHLDYLEYHYPEVAGPLKRLPDDFNKWSDIYRAVKKFVPNAANAKKDAARVDANLAKPKSMSTTGITQTGQSGGARLSDDQKAANWARMQKSLRGLS